MTPMPSMNALTCHNTTMVNKQYYYFLITKNTGNFKRNYLHVIYFLGIKKFTSHPNVIFNGKNTHISPLTWKTWATNVRTEKVIKKGGTLLTIE